MTAREMESRPVNIPALTTAEYLQEISTQLNAMAAVAKAAVACAEGSESDAIRIILDLDETLHETKTLHEALILINRIRQR